MIVDTEKDAFSKNPLFDSHLGMEVFRSLVGSKDQELLIDLTRERKVMTSHTLVAMALCLRKRVLEQTQKQRVGILFPPGIGGFMANIAVILAGKVPVNINFTLGPAAFDSCIGNADIDLLITAIPVLSKLKDKNLKLPENKIELLRFVKDLPKAEIVRTLFSLKILPSSLSSRVYNIPRKGGASEAGLLFTSGSSGEPKGVVLSHRNILGNCAQIDAFGILPKGEVLLSNLPIFHSFGFTVSLWYALLRQMRSVTYPSPTDIRKCADAIESENVSVMLGTPTFFKPYLRKIEPHKLKSLKYVIAGAEKTPPELPHEWFNTFGSEYLEGYGLTETTPVVAVNKPLSTSRAGEIGKKEKSVGKMVNGMSAKILNPETMEPTHPTEPGILMLSGINIFEGYLNQPEKTAEVLKDSWFTTGDIARFDEDGFLYIEGRLSRFSKIGGEMVPHATIENAIIRLFNIDESEGRQLVVAGRSDAVKGEALVILSTQELEIKEIATQLKEDGFANLWIPKIIKIVDHIPCLATGKLDLREIAQVAAQD